MGAGETSSAYYLTGLLQYLNDTKFIKSLVKYLASGKPTMNSGLLLLHLLCCEALGFLLASQNIVSSQCLH